MSCLDYQQRPPRVQQKVGSRFSLGGEFSPSRELHQEQGVTSPSESLLHNTRFITGYGTFETPVAPSGVGVRCPSESTPLNTRFTTGYGTFWRLFGRRQTIRSPSESTPLNTRITTRYGTCGVQGAPDQRGLRLPSVLAPLSNRFTTGYGTFGTFWSRHWSNNSNNASPATSTGGSSS